MNTPDRKFGLVLLAMIVVVSGCTDNSQNTSVSISQTDGVQIESYQATPATLSGGQPATLQMNIKNKGGVDAENVQAKLTNPEFGSDSGLWSVSGGQWKDAFETLRGPDPDAGQNALTRTIQWQVTAPNKNNEVPIPYDFSANLFYKYQTQAVTQMKMVNTNSVEGQPTRSTPSIDNTGGPVQMGVQASSPVLFTAESGGSSKTQPLCITIENSGSGTPFLYEESKVNGAAYRGVSDDITNTINLTVETSSSFLGFGADADKSTTVEKELIGSNPSTCIDMTSNYVSTSEGSKTATITVTADYGYRLQDNTQITLKTGP
ncbi:hypothetical protein [Candidatus Nanohalovita haloferacivicina]|uniref:hypothetical protein n=1 Tax=Candidatus Nanohalovita haloferacivicina TaxID=2978046 RepID=UPI00325FCCD8|nr:hypothetical protein HBNXNv_1103 [Candidatus Nanohalobia archaeon BNXNv]